MQFSLFPRLCAALLLLLPLTAQAVPPDYSVTPITIPQQPDDVRGYLGGRQFADNNHVVFFRRSSTQTQTQLEIYSLSNPGTPVRVLDDQSHPRGLEINTAIIGDWLYLERAVGGVSVGLQRCQYLVACDYNNSADWQSVAPPPVDGSFYYPQLSSNFAHTGHAVFISTENGVATLSMVTDTGNTFAFGPVGETGITLTTAGYVGNNLVVIYRSNTTGTHAVVFEENNLSTAGAYDFLLESDTDLIPFDMNANGRLVLARNSSTPDARFCDLQIQVADVTPTGVTCPQQAMPAVSRIVFTGNFTSRISDDGLFRWYSFSAPADFHVIDTNDLAAGEMQMSDFTNGALAEPLIGITMTDGRSLTAKLADATSNPSLFYNYYLLDVAGPPSGNTLTVDATPTAVGPGDDPTITVTIDVTATDLYAVEVTCTSDPSLVQFVDGSYPSIPDTLVVPQEYDPATGTWTGALGFRAPAQPFTGTGRVATLTFMAQAASGTAQIQCSALGSDINGNAMAIDADGATIVIDDGIHAPGGATVSGVATLPYGSSEGIQVTLTTGTTSITTTTDAGGNYSFDDIRDGSFSISFLSDRHVAQCVGITITGGSNPTVPNTQLVAGDINNDKVIDIADFTYMAGRFGSTSGTPRYSAIADLNVDGRINVQDLAILGSHFGMMSCSN